jgi:hypothetical protein
MATFFSYDSDGTLLNSFNVEDEDCLDENGNFSSEISIAMIKDTCGEETNLVYCDPNLFPQPVFPFSTYVNGVWTHPEEYYDTVEYDADGNIIRP